MSEAAERRANSANPHGLDAACSATPFAAERSRHVSMLWVATLIVAASLALEVRPDQRVALSWLRDSPLPDSCASRAWFGVECPGCGLTRSLIHLAHGRWQESWAVHRVGWLVALFAVAQFPYRTAALVSGNPRPLGERFPRFVVPALTLLLIANWLVNLFLQHPKLS